MVTNNFARIMGMVIIFNFFLLLYFLVQNAIIFFFIMLGVTFLQLLILIPKRTIQKSQTI